MENYIGKRVILLVDRPIGGNAFKGDIGQIISKGTINFPRHKGYSYSNYLRDKDITWKLYDEEPIYEIY